MQKYSNKKIETTGNLIMHVPKTRQFETVPESTKFTDKSRS